MSGIALGPELGSRPKNLFVVSDLLLRRLPEAARPFPASRGIATLLGLDVPVAFCEYADASEADAEWQRLVKAFEALGMPIERVAAESEECEIPALVLKDPSVEERHLDGDDKDDRLSRFRTTIRFDREAIGLFSRVTGLTIRYCTSRYLTQPPLPFEAGVLNIHMGTRPPGQHGDFSVKVREVFGCKVWSDGEERLVHGPVAWRGRLLSSDGIPVCQVLGNNYYQIVLMHSEANNGFDRSRLWERMLSLMARDLTDPPSAPPPEATTEDVETGVRGMLGRRTEDLQAALRKLEFELGDLQKKLVQTLRQRDEKVMLLRALRHEMADAAERCGQDLVRLRAMADVASVRIDPEEGLLVETAPIALEHGGRRYDLGAFRIHLAADGDIAVWSESPQHPKGHHHPHVDRSSLECLGNITLAVAKHASDYRFADALTMILRWLRSYRPETTHIPLEEFPSVPIPDTKGAVRGKKKPTELLAPVQAARSEGAQARDADRGRRRRQPGGIRARQDGRAQARRLGR